MSVRVSEASARELVRLLGELQSFEESIVDGLTGPDDNEPEEQRRINATFREEARRDWKAAASILIELERQGVPVRGILGRGPLRNGSISGTVPVPVHVEG